MFNVLVLVSQALQDFDLALRGKKKRAQFLKQGKKKVLTVWSSEIKHNSGFEPKIIE